MGINEALDDLENEYRDLVRRQHALRAQTQCMPSPVLVLVSPEADSLCSARMITHMLGSDDVMFTVRPVITRGQLIAEAKKVLEDDENVISLLLINCGGSIPLVEELSLQSHVRVYLLDSHRPYNLSNYHAEQVRILHDCLDKGLHYPMPYGEDDMDEEEEEAEIEEMRRRDQLEDEEDEDEEEDSDGEGGRRADGSEGAGEDGEPSAKRRKRDAKLRARRARDEAWAEERRQRREGTFAERRARENARIAAVTRYYSGTSYGCATAVLMYELGKQLRKAGNTELWYSILGLTDQFIHERVAPGQYAALQSMMSKETIGLGNETREQMREAQDRRSAQEGNKAVDATVTRVGHIGDYVEYRFPLLRHWSLFDSMVHSPYVSARLETWTETGREKLKTLLTELGIPTRDAQQGFKVLGAEQKRKLEQEIEEKGADARYGIPDCRYKSFVKQQTPTLALTATDTVLALSALLELPFHASPASRSPAVSPLSSSSSSSAASSSSSSSSAVAGAGAASHSAWNWEVGFWLCWDALGSDAKASSLLVRGVSQAIEACKAMLRAVDLAMTTRQIKPGGDFRYVTLSDALGESALFARPQHLSRLGLFLSECAHKSKGSQKPLVVASPIPALDTHLVLSVLGTTLTPETQAKNPFGARFHEVAAPALPEREEEEGDDLSDEERRAWFVEQGMEDLSLLRVKQEAFDYACVEVQSEDMPLFLSRLTLQMED